MNHPALRTSVFALLLTAVFCGRMPGDEFAGAGIMDLFARPAAAVPAPAAPTSAGELDFLDLTAVSSSGGRTMVSLTDRRTQRSRWLAVGGAADGIAAAEFDPVRDAVCVVEGSIRRWIELRRVGVQALPVARRDDGSIDWVHMRRTEKQKAEEAEAMLWDILEAGRLARAGQLKSPP